MEVHTNTKSFELRNTSQEFLDCFNFGQRRQKYMRTYIKCHIIRKITCGTVKVLHYDESEVICDWTYNNTTSKFEVSINITKTLSTSHSITNLKIDASDLIGYLRCRIKDQSYTKFYIDDPFLLRKDERKKSSKKIQPNDTKMDGGNAVTIGLICICLSIAAISAVYFYTKKKKPIGEKPQS